MGGAELDPQAAGRRFWPHGTGRWQVPRQRKRLLFSARARAWIHHQNTPLNELRVWEDHARKGTSATDRVTTPRLSLTPAQRVLLQTTEARDSAQAEASALRSELDSAKEQLEASAARIAALEAARDEAVAEKAKLKVSLSWRWNLTPTRRVFGLPSHGLRARMPAHLWR